jgi:hypothetical protein
MKASATLKSILFLLAISLVLIPSLAGAQVSRSLIPYAVVPKVEDRNRLLKIAQEYTIYRELKPFVIQGTRQQFKFLLDNLDLTTYIVRNLDLGNQTLRKVDTSTFEGNDGEGLHGRMNLILRDDARRVYLAQGKLEEGFFFDVEGRAAIVAEQDHPNKDKQVIRLFIYIKLDNQFLDVMAHIFSPLLSGAVTGRISKFLTAASIASQAIYQDPNRIQKILNTADNIDPALKTKFEALFLSEGENEHPVDIPKEESRVGLTSDQTKRE